MKCSRRCFMCNITKQCQEVSYVLDIKGRGQSWNCFDTLHKHIYLADSLYGYVIIERFSA